MFKIIINQTDLKRNFDFYYIDNIAVFICPKDRNFPYIKNGKAIHIMSNNYYEIKTIKLKKYDIISLSFNVVRSWIDF